jgi:hypothetical protein
MPDIVARIVLQASGGNQAANEIKKVGEAAREARRDSAGGFGASIGGNAGGGGYERSSSGLYIPSGMDALRQEHKEFLDITRKYGKKNPTKAPERNVGAGRASDGRENTGFGFIRGAAQGVEDIGSGDLIGGAGTGIAGLSRMLGGAAGAIALAAGLSIYAGNKLATNSTEWGGQFNKSSARLGYNLSDLVGIGKNFKSGMVGKAQGTGMGDQILQFMNALGEFGGSKIKESDLFNTDKSNHANVLSQAFYEGVDPTIQARYIALKQHGGMGYGELFGTNGRNGISDMPGISQANKGRFITDISNIVEQAMSMGIKKGSSTLLSQSYAVGINNLMQFGHASIEGAESIYNKQIGFQRSIGGGIKSAEQAWSFMQFRRNGDSYTDTLMRAMNASPDETYERIRTMFPNDIDGQRIALMQTLGVNVEEAQRIIDSHMGSEEAANRKMDRNIPSINAAKILTLTPPDVGSDYLRNQRSTEGGLKAIGEALSNVFGNVRESIAHPYDNRMSTPVGRVVSSLRDMNWSVGLPSALSQAYNKTKVIPGSAMEDLSAQMSLYNTKQLPDSYLNMKGAGGKTESSAFATLNNLFKNVPDLFTNKIDQKEFQTNLMQGQKPDYIPDMISVLNELRSELRTHYHQTVTDEGRVQVESK